MGQFISSITRTKPVDGKLAQSYPEVEMFQEESDLHQRRDECKKNPGHLHFIPVADFNIDHLPEGHREQLCLDYVKTVISLTVRLVVYHVSSGRPSKDYPLSEHRGKNPRAVGSGMVEWMHRKFTDDDGQTCLCRTCKKLPARDRKKQWGKFGVVTAKHVVHDHNESIETEIYVDYDNDTDRDTCPKLYGAGVRESVTERGGYARDMGKDECEVYIVSHERDVCSMLEERIERYGDLHEKIQHRGNRGSSKRHIVCVSHPHGMSKHVSVGEFLGEDKYWPFNWSYTTPTCSGSSGAPVFRLGEKWDLYTDTGYMTYHSGACKLTGMNKSGRYGWWR